MLITVIAGTSDKQNGFGAKCDGYRGYVAAAGPVRMRKKKAHSYSVHERRTRTRLWNDAFQICRQSTCNEARQTTRVDDMFVNFGSSLWYSVTDLNLRMTGDSKEDVQYDMIIKAENTDKNE